jgi:hypothetical protein
MVLGACGGFASAGTVGFVARGADAAVLDGVRTVARLSADASSFTIEFENASGSGAMTAFYIEAGAALSGLGGASIHNGQGVMFAEGAGAPRDGAGASAPGAAYGGADGRFDSTGATSLGGGLIDAAGGRWSGEFFSMARVGGLDAGQATGQSVSITFSHDGSFSLDRLLAAIAADEIRFLQRYQGFGVDGEQGWMSSIAVVVPLPPAVLAGLGLLGVIGIGRIAARRRR